MFSARKCLKHIVHAGNIWLHLAPCLFLVCVMIPYIMRSSHDHAAAYFFVLLPEAVCLLLSSAYHTFMAQVKDYSLWLRVDVRSHETAVLNLCKCLITRRMRLGFALARFPD
jgi:predicted membrane channel-forming protein YqfA (hemolysin III family)